MKQVIESLNYLQQKYWLMKEWNTTTVSWRPENNIILFPSNFIGNAKMSHQPWNIEIQSIFL